MAYLQSKLNTALIPHAIGRDERLELPEEALREAVVNAIAHRDYRSSANVQIYIFHDRVEIVTPGGLPAGMREKDLGVKSVPRNPLLFGILQRMDLVEQIGSGIRRIRQLCREQGVPIPVIDVSNNWVTTTFPRATGHNGDQVRTRLLRSQSNAEFGRIPLNQKALDNIMRSFERDTGQVTGQVAGQVLVFCEEPKAASEIQKLLGLKHRDTFQNNYLKPLLVSGWIGMTLPDKPTSSRQKYQITSRGKAVLRKAQENAS